MAWSYYCDTEQMDIVAETKEELAEKLREHMAKQHDRQISYDEALRAVDMNAKQKAA